MHLNQAEFTQLLEPQLSHMARTLYVFYLQPEARKQLVIIDLATLTSKLNSYSETMPCTAGLREVTAALNELERVGLIAKDIPPSNNPSNDWNFVPLKFPLLEAELKQVPSRPFNMTPTWEPSAHLRNEALLVGLSDCTYTQQELRSFINYWCTTPRTNTQNGWEKLFVQHLLRKRVAAAGGTRRYSSGTYKQQVELPTRQLGPSQTSSSGYIPLAQQQQQQQQQQHQLQYQSQTQHYSLGANTNNNASTGAFADNTPRHGLPYSPQGNGNGDHDNGQYPIAPQEGAPNYSAGTTSFPVTTNPPQSNYAVMAAGATAPDTSTLPAATVFVRDGAPSPLVRSRYGRSEQGLTLGTSGKAERVPTLKAIMTGKDDYESIAPNYTKPRLPSDPIPDALHTGRDVAIPAPNYTPPPADPQHPENTVQIATLVGRVPTKAAFNAGKIMLPISLNPDGTGTEETRAQRGFTAADLAEIEASFTAQPALGEFLPKYSKDIGLSLGSHHREEAALPLIEPESSWSQLPPPAAMPTSQGAAYSAPVTQTPQSETAMPPRLAPSQSPAPLPAMPQAQMQMQEQAMDYPQWQSLQAPSAQAPRYQPEQLQQSAPQHQGYPKEQSQQLPLPEQPQLQLPAQSYSPESTAPHTSMSPAASAAPSDPPELPAPPALPDKTATAAAYVPLDWSKISGNHGGSS